MHHCRRTTTCLPARLDKTAHSPRCVATDENNPFTKTHRPAIPPRHEPTQHAASIKRHRAIPIREAGAGPLHDPLPPCAGCTALHVYFDLRILLPTRHYPLDTTH